MTDRLIDVFAEGLNLPAEKLSDATSPDNTSEWDSLASMNLVALIEERFQVELSTTEIMKMRSIGVARAVLRGKNVAEI